MPGPDAKDGPAAADPSPVSKDSQPVPVSATNGSDSGVAVPRTPVPKDSQVPVAPTHVSKDSPATPASATSATSATTGSTESDGSPDAAMAVSQRLPASTVVATGPDGPLTLHLAAVRDGDVLMHPLIGGAVALRGDVAFAVVPPTAGSPRREQAWLRGLTDLDGAMDEASTVLGGRWPDATFIGFTVEYDRSGVSHPVQRWQDGGWVEVAVPPAPGPVDSFYAAYVGGPDGAVLGLRSHDLGTVDSDLTEVQVERLRKVLRRVRPAVDRIDVAAPVAWPELPVGPVGSDLLAFPDGTLIVLRSGPKLERWTPGARSWKSLPAVGYKATGYYDSPTLVGRDPARLYLFSCADTLEGKARLHLLVDDAWQAIATPGGKCVYSLSEDADGSLWMVAGGQLYRHPAPAPTPGATPSPAWQSITLPSMQLPARPRTWWFDSDVGEWKELPGRPAREQALEPSRVLALGSGDVWFTAQAGDSLYRPGQPYRVVLTTRPIDAPIVLPDPGRIDIEASALGQPPVGPECDRPLLELGAVTDAPATARPPALVGDPLFGLAVVASESGARHDIAVLYMTRTPPEADVMSARLTALAETLRPSFPRLRLSCGRPRIVAVLP
jgi:hypothetical protein